MLATEVEALSVQKPNSKFFTAEMLDYSPVREGELLPFHVHHVKGWTRSVALHLTLALLKEEGFMDRYLAAIPNDKKNSFCTIIASTVSASTAVGIDLNRGWLLLYSEAFKVAA